jgi:hypothetical protein
MQGPARPRPPRRLTVPPSPTLLPPVTRARAAARRPLRAVSPTACHPLLHERASTRMRRSSPSRWRRLTYPRLSRTLARPPSRSALHANVPVPFVPSRPSCPPATRASLLHECTSTRRRPSSPSRRLAHLVPPPAMRAREYAHAPVVPFMAAASRPPSPLTHPCISTLTERAARTCARPPLCRLTHPRPSYPRAAAPTRHECASMHTPPLRRLTHPGAPFALSPPVHPRLSPTLHVYPRPPPVARAHPPPSCCLTHPPSPLAHIARPPSRRLEAVSPTPCRTSMRSPRCPLRLHDHPHAVSTPSRPPPVARPRAHPGAPFAACSPVQPLPPPTWHDHPHAVLAREHARHHPAAQSRPTTYQRTAMLLHCSRAVYYRAIPISILIHILFVLFLLFIIDGPIATTLKSGISVKKSQGGLIKLI